MIGIQPGSSRLWKFFEEITKNKSGDYQKLESEFVKG